MLENQYRTVSWKSTVLKIYADVKPLPRLKKETKERVSLFERNARAWMSLVLLGTDLLTLLGTILLASELYQLSPVFMNPSQDGIFGVLALMLAALFLRRGLYPTVGMHYVDELRHIVTSSLVAFLVIIAVTFVFQMAALAPILGLAGLLSMFMIPIARYFVRKWCIRWNVWGEPVAIIGDADRAQALVTYFTANMQLGIRPVSILSDPLLIRDGQWLCPALPICKLKLFAREYSLNTVLVLVDDLNDIDRLVARYRFVFQRVILMKEQNRSFALASLRSLDFLNVLGLQVKNDLLDAGSQLSKRIVDVLASSVAIVLLSPLLASIALLIKLDTGGRVFYRQHRVGKNGRTFSLLKFRTMHIGADQVLKDALARDPEMKKEWDSYQKLKNDPRITRVGEFLRRFSLDELPQLYNIMKGEMSIVGPRPIMLSQRKLYGDPIKLYIRVAPGITGLWQVSGRNETTFSDRAVLDIEYIERWSHWLDIYILFKTIKVVFWSKGAY